ncbi:abortive infection system antitoxin AbiGi family protein [Stenotrophomonas sp. GD03993]|uniref:abortive infection system antitoxin AbiGi family protein n=1 Tax=unclassified Stenotrophomonas TaxID=196198 RepID=UPI0024497E40|nr:MULTISPECIES: abortive infection system antitoxin AbiGi family protein [unclassified Stenotrophomonas]MDH0185933.1 abortive infection system antitoxin AbiGi family protein [Stenotrophomonas sp. GD04051]MDH0462299.1 abortive infection system antitoxin AbiGi family protein [Stenotrophomonas sp. GD03993]MDH0875102.1 abortive infection system antitoxin AbiGi family protein [Stenotrophomonas sp. GD03877]MDH2154622.1 abortive infection system antitoxin AbiGi family protein [Stenotrophomonas sp. GD
MKNLLGIIEHGFKLKYCKETFSLLGREESLHVPMVSFCDIPFSQIKNHINSYGCYGVGLSKEWAIRNGLNPVLYVQDNSMLAKSYYALMTFLHAKEEAGEIDKAPRRMGVDIVRYIKNYEGMLARKNRKPVRYRFSDEREWRYVPEYSDKYESVYIPEDFVVKTAVRANADLRGLSLTFEPDDISYIVIARDSEIRTVAAHLNETKSDRYTVAQAQRLMTRIITNEQIQGDF